MKSTGLVLIITVLIAGLLIISCQSSAEKVKNAENNLQEANENVTDAERDLNAALNDSISDYQKFRKEANDKIIANEKSMAEFKARIAREKIENRARYEKKLAELENKNSDLKKRLADYKDNGESNWVSFKNEFNHDLDEIGKAFKDITVKNVK